MRKRNMQRGFTLIELMIVVFMIFVVAGVLIYGVLGHVLLAGNYWILSDDAALKCAQLTDVELGDDPKVVKITRNVLAPSEVLIKNASGAQFTIYVDADILQNLECAGDPKTFD